ncbi:MAG: VanZ family protein [Firmicutes bacterium]|nr:VanZ family protein [Bacillota bacterium]
MRTNSLSTCIYITAMVLILVVFMPAVDIFVCRKLKLNLMGGISENPRAKSLLALRKGLIYLVFLAYLAGFSYVVFLSRNASDEYLIHIALFQNLASSVRIDFGVLGTLYYLITGNFSEIGRHFEIIRFSGISQVYLNIMLFIPMGYLLPYMFKWFRSKIRIKTLIASFLISLAVENIQLITKRGFYDMDDLFTNTLGGFLGGLLFTAFAFRVTYPDWKAELKRYRRWKKNAKERTLYPFAKNVDQSRTVLRATDESKIYDFYVTKLGFRGLKQLIPEDDPGTSFLFELGSFQVEIRCSNKEEQLPEQNLVITASKLDKVKKRLEENGIETGPFEADPYTDLERFSFKAPDNVTVTVIGDR